MLGFSAMRKMNDSSEFTWEWPGSVLGAQGRRGRRKDPARPQRSPDVRDRHSADATLNTPRKELQVRSHHMSSAAPESTEPQREINTVNNYITYCTSNP